VTSENGAPRVNGYEQFFGFTEPPFSLSVNTRFRFASASHEAALSQVAYALGRREPVVVVTGDMGMGKTLLCRTVVERLPRKTFLSVINDPFLSRDDLLKQILQDFGVISTESGGAADISRHDLARALEKFLASLSQLTAHAAVIVDEAQYVQPDALEQIRLLANVHDDRGTLLQIVLVGQPDLQQRLSSPELEQLRQRVSRIINLDALTDEEVKSYIAHRLVVARQTPTESVIPGAQDLVRAIAEWNDSSWPPTFTDEAIDVVSRLSRGVPRLVNLLCDRALETAYAQQSRTVDASEINTAATLLQLPNIAADTVTRPARRATSRVRTYVAGAAAVALAGAIIWFGGRMLAQVRHADRGPDASAAAAVQDTPGAVVKSAPLALPPAEPPPRSVVPVAPDVDGGANRRAPDRGGDTNAGGFEIVVASFRTEARATDVAGQLAELDHRAHRRATGSWYQVIVGPFGSRPSAEEAQRRLDRAGFTGTKIVPETR
jgi:general secretion pathway protein A